MYSANHAHLKKVLALVMAFAMAFTMMASAAYTDQADIVCTEAVDTLAALNVMTGDPDGSFRPNDTVTRAEMCRMIYSIRSGGKDDASGYAGMQTTFKDVANDAWYAGYVKYCQSAGIVSGKSATTFDPAANVTGVEAALMCLRVMGYDPARADIGGSTWSITTIGLATENGLLDDVDCTLTAGLPRQYAAQIMYNMIDAETVKWSTDTGTYDNTSSDTGKKYETVGEKYMDLNKVTATMISFDKTSGKDTYECKLDPDTIDEGETTDGVKSVSFTKIAKDYSDLKFKKVKVLFEEGKTDKVYGIFATDDNSSEAGLLKNLKMDGNKKAKLDGTKYDLADDTTVYINGDVLYEAKEGAASAIDGFTTKSTDAKTDENKKVKASIEDWIDQYGDDSSVKYQNNQFWQGTEVELLATDGSTNFSILKVETHAIGKVSAVGSDYINVTWKGGDHNVLSETKLEEDDWDYYDGIKKDDYVVITAPGNYASGNGRVEKAEVVSGKVTGTKSTDGVSIGGEWYTMAGKKENGDPYVKRPSTGSNVDLVLVNGYVYYSDTTAGSIDDVALLVEAAAKGGTGSLWEARMIFADGTDKTVEIEKYWEDEDNKSNKIPEISEDEDDPILVTYEVSGGKYTLTKVGAAKTFDDSKGEFETAGYDAYVSGIELKTDGSIKGGTMSIKDDEGKDLTALSRLYYESTGVVFVKYKGSVSKDENNNPITNDDGQTIYTDADYKVVSGKVASDYDKDVRRMMAVADKDGSGYYAQAAFIDLGSGSTGGGADNYAVVIDDVVKDTNDGTKYDIPAWNGSEEITITTDDSAAKSLKKGHIFSWTGSTDDADIDTYSQQADFYVTAFDSGSGDIELVTGHGTDAQTAQEWYESHEDWTELDVDGYTVVDSSDSVILFVNSDDGEGISGMNIDDIELSYYFDEDFWSSGKVGTGEMTEDDAPNVRCYFDDDDYITVIVVDVNRNIQEW